jgi:predicted transcriptional regulator
MTQLEDLDEVISIIGNPTKRLILERLSHGSSYPLQIAKDMGLSQQLVSSHLNTMERSGLVDSQLEESTRGPKRKIYSLSRSLLITIEVAPFLFNSRMISFNMRPELSKISTDSSDFLDQLDLIDKKEEGQEKITAFSTLLQEIDSMLDTIESERAVLLYIRNLVVGKAFNQVNKVEVPNARRVLYYVLNSHNENVGSISNKLNLREETVRAILKQLRKDQALPL